MNECINSCSILFMENLHLDKPCFDLTVFFRTADGRTVNICFNEETANANPLSSPRINEQLANALTAFSATAVVLGYYQESSYYPMLRVVCEDGLFRYTLMFTSDAARKEAVMMYGTKGVQEGSEDTFRSLIKHVLSFN